MSAWYVFAAIGFYPLNPVSGEYQLCSPLFDKSTLHLTGNRSLEIICKKMSPNAVFISKIALNGKLFDKNFITYRQIMQGGKLEIWLQEKPGTWGSGSINRAKGL
jgi:putative alpha-1,2-mannosidase